MMLGLYVALGGFLLLGVPNPSAHRSLLAYAAWGDFAPGAVRAVMAFRASGDRAGCLFGSGFGGNMVRPRSGGFLLKRNQRSSNHPNNLQKIFR